MVFVTVVFEIVELELFVSMRMACAGTKKPSRSSWMC